MGVINLGIDFGSTCTTLSYWDESGKLVAIQQVPGRGAQIPTVVAKMEDIETLFGLDALEVAGDSLYRYFPSCKMLISELKEDVIRANGYEISGDNSPREIAKSFLQRLIDIARNRTGAEIGNIYIGVPEVWFKTMSYAGGTRILRDIVREILHIKPSDQDAGKRVRVVSEPIAAAALFANNYKRLSKSNKSFDGRMLLVDYGGGTLDIALLKVQPNPENADKITMEVERRSGEGQNTRGKIGAAGILFMQAVMEHALRDSGISLSEDARTDREFLQQINKLDQRMQGQQEKVNDAFKSAKPRMQGLKDEKGEPLHPAEIHPNKCYMKASMGNILQPVFMVSKYNDTPYKVTYQHILDAYNEVICGVLARELRDIMIYMKDHNIPYEAGNITKDDFKIAEVGGFCTFCLVKKQIHDTFDLSGASGTVDDIRQRYMSDNHDDMLCAVSYGAALLANDMVSIRHSSPWTIGIRRKNYQEGWNYCQVAMNKGESIDYDKPYFANIPGTERPISFLIKNGIDQLWVCDQDDGMGYVVDVPEADKDEISKKVNLLGISIMNIAFSMDSSNVYSIYFYPEDEEKRKDSSNIVIVELDNAIRLLMNGNNGSTDIAGERRKQD